MNTESILVIDDNVDLCVFIELVLKGKSFECRTANTISSAWRVLESFQPNIIFLDLILPDAFSMDILENIHAKCPMASIIIMTSWEKEDFELPGYVYGWLYKPFNTEELIDIIGSVKNKDVLIAE